MVMKVVVPRFIIPLLLLAYTLSGAEQGEVLPPVTGDADPPAAAAVAPEPLPAETAAAEPAEPTAAAPPSAPLVLLSPPSSEESLSTTRENVFEAVDILGDGLLFSPVIWSDLLKLNESDRVVQQQIEEKKFANDEYFMRNIDREEFEEERLLMLFEDRARLYEKYITEMRQRLSADSADAAR